VGLDGVLLPVVGDVVDGKQRELVEVTVVGVLHVTLGIRGTVLDAAGSVLGG
jgi:hypothetical protein